MESVSAAVDVAGDSTEHLQKSLHTLLDQNGIMLDLRAHLRSHLVMLLRSTQTGHELLCKELLFERLELKFQAINILIAEYLLRQEFKYTLSVFASEIPLASMVFQYATSLVESDKEQQSSDLRISETDIWQILNCLGVRCDSEHAARMVETYCSSTQRMPLLLCLLQSLQLYRAADYQTSGEGQSSAQKADNPSGLKNSMGTDVCGHISICETCQASRQADRDSYVSKKKSYVKDVDNLDSRSRCYATSDSEEVIAVEEDLVKEMFEQLRSVHAGEAELWRERQAGRLQQAYSAYEQQLADKERELEEGYRQRCEALEEGVRDRKRFLWQLARSLRRQHAVLADAVREVQLERRQLSRREENFKEQLKNAEEVLKKNGEEMRNQLSQELKVLEEHIDIMREERASMDQERSRLESIKQSIPNQSDELKTEFEAQKRKNDDLQRHYDSLKNELTVVKGFIATSKFLDAKCLVESSSMTDIFGVTSNLCVTLNNEEMKKYPLDGLVDPDSSLATNLGGNKENVLMRDVSKTKMAGHQLVNDLTKFKNVNFKSDAIVQVNMEVECFTSAWQARPASARHCSCLRTFADQGLRAELTAAQRVIEHMARLAAVAAPLAAPPPPPPHACAGGGEQSGRAEERDAPPGGRAAPRDPLAFVGTLVKSKDSGRRPSLLSPWNRFKASAPRLRPPLRARRTSDGRPHPETYPVDTPTYASPTSSHEGLTPVQRWMSRSGHRDALRRETMEYGSKKMVEPIVAETNVPEREKLSVSPTRDVLAAAKKRLRKLEIEAEAVERSYLDFRNRRSAEKNSATAAGTAPDEGMKKTSDQTAVTPRAINGSSSLFTKCIHNNSPYFNLGFPSKVSPVGEIDENGSEYDQTMKVGTELNSGYMPNPLSCSVMLPTFEGKVNENKPKRNLVEKPLMEFRKLYKGNRLEPPTARLNRALQVLKNQEQTSSTGGEYKISSMEPTRSKSIEHLRDAAMQLINKRPSTPDGTPTTKLTESQLLTLKKNIKKIYNIDSTQNTESTLQVENEAVITYLNPNSIKPETVADKKKKDLRFLQNNFETNGADLRSQVVDSKNNTDAVIEADDSEMPDKETIVLNNEMDIETISNETCIHDSSIQTDVREYKKPTSILVLIESNMNTEPFVETKDEMNANETQKKSDLPKSNSQIITNAEPSDETQELQNHKEVTGDVSKSLTLNQNVLVTNGNMEKSTQHLLNSEIKNGDNFETEVKSTSYIDMTDSENKIYTEALAIVKEANVKIMNGEPMKAEQTITAPETEFNYESPDDYSNEGFSVDVEYENELETDNSPISVGTNQSDSFWK